MWVQTLPDISDVLINSSNLIIDHQPYQPKYSRFIKFMMVNDYSCQLYTRGIARFISQGNPVLYIGRVPFFHLTKSFFRQYTSLVPGKYVCLEGFNYFKAVYLGAKGAVRSFPKLSCKIGLDFRLNPNFVPDLSCFSSG